MAEKDGTQCSEVLSSLERIEELLTALVKIQLRPAIDEARQDDRERVIYDNVGRMNGSELAKEARISAGQVSRTLQKWQQQGLLVKEGAQYRRVV